MAESTAAPPTNTVVPESEEKWVLLTTIMASSMAFIGASALNLAQDAIQTGLNASLADLLWVINAYALMLAALLLIGGSLGDHFGRKRVFLAGVAIFSGASVACGLAPTVETLIAFRAIQGIGAALLVPGSLAILSATVAPARRGRNIGLWSTFGALFQVIGPILGGVLASTGLWRGVFFINLPIALVVFYAARRVPETFDEDARGQALDYVGAVLATLGLAALTYGFLQGDARGWGDPLILGALIGGALVLVAFIFWEGTTGHPMMPLKLFKSRTFAGTNMLTLFLYGALAGLLTFLPLNLIQVQGYDESIAGLTLLPLTFLLAGMSRWAGAWMDRVGARLPLTIGPIITGFGFMAFALPGVTDGPSDYWFTFFPAIVLVGIGMGITVAPLTTAVMSSAPSSQSGVASGINNAVSRTAGVLAVAVMGALALVAFRETFMTNLEGLRLPNDTMAALENRAEDLGRTSTDGLDLSAEQEATVQRYVRESFADTWRVLSIFAAALTWLSALLGFMIIRNEDLEGSSDTQPNVVHADQGCPQHIDAEPAPAPGD